MSVRSDKEMKKSRIIGITWTALILAMASVVGLTGHQFLGAYLEQGSQQLVFITIARKVFHHGRHSGCDHEYRGFPAACIFLRICV